MRYLLQVLASLFVVVILAGDSLYAERIFTDSDLRKYEGESPDSTEGSDSKGNLQGRSSNTKDEEKAMAELHGQCYADYKIRIGMLLLKIGR